MAALRLNRQKKPVQRGKGVIMAEEDFFDVQMEFLKRHEHCPLLIFNTETGQIRAEYSAGTVDCAGNIRENTATFYFPEDYLL